MIQMISLTTLLSRDEAEAQLRPLSREELFIGWPSLPHAENPTAHILFYGPCNVQAEPLEAERWEGSSDNDMLSVCEWSQHNLTELSTVQEAVAIGQPGTWTIMHYTRG